jgi:alpha-D-ribose 1-methylphosphonate 5-triphosphate synthase subunit PhnG
MNRRRRTEILVKGSREIARALAEEIVSKYEIKEIKRPENGLVMIKMREKAQNTLFYLGEVLVSETRIQIGKVDGLGIVKGNDNEMSRWMAIIDGAYNAGLLETLRWKHILEKEEGNIEKRLLAERSRILRTKVDFETMDA